MKYFKKILSIITLTKKYSSLLILVYLSILIFALSGSINAQKKLKPLLGNYNSQPRKNGHIDLNRLINGLKSLNADTYMFLINGENDWADLKTFLPRASKEGISVWAYLRPPSETPPENPGDPYSEPYKNNYITWAKAIAELSIKNPNLIGYVIDDFWYNTPAYKRGNLFSTYYIRQMVEAGKSINPQLKFYPLLYYRQIGLQFIDSLSTLIDGVVAAYPGQIKDPETISDSLAILKALSFTNDQYQVIMTSLPEATHSIKGDYIFASKKIKVDNPTKAEICFSHFSDRAANFGYYPQGYHQIQVRIDDKIVWNCDAADSNGTLTINLAGALKGKKNCKLSIGLYNNFRVSNYYVHAELQIISMQGIEYITPSWKIEKKGNYNISIRLGNGSHRLPLIAMPVGNVTQYLKRYFNPASTKNIAKRVRTIINFLKTLQIEGIVTFALDLNQKDEIFKAVRSIYKSFRLNY